MSTSSPTLKPLATARPKISRRGQILARLPHWVWAFFTSLTVTLIYTRNLVTHLGNAVPQGGTDIYENLWNYWWMRHALFDLHTDPFHTDFLYYPAGVSLRLHSFQPFLSGVAALLYYIFGQILTLNLMILASLTLGVWGAYLLFHYIGGSKLAAFAGGLVFVFCNSYLWDYLQSGQTNLIALEWLPLYTLCLLRALDNQPRLKLNIALAIIFLLVASLCDWYYALHLILLTAVVTAFYLIFRARDWRARRDVLLKAVVIGVVYLLLISPIILPMLAQARAQPWLAPSADQSLDHSVDLLSFVIPNDHSWLYGWLAQKLPLPFYQHYDPTTGIGFYNPTGVDGSFNPGLIPLGLAIFALVLTWRRRKSRQDTPKVGVWLTLALFFGIMALGPELHLDGQDLSLVKLPYWLLYRLPFLNIARDPGNFLVPYDLALGALTAIGLTQLGAWLNQKFEQRPRLSRWQPALLSGFLLTTLIGSEFLSVDLPVDIIAVPKFYQQLASDPANYAILELPAYKQNGGVEHFAMYYQTFHQKQLFGGQLARDHKRTGPLDLLKHSPVFHETLLDKRADFASQHDILPAPDLFHWSLSILNYYQVRYIVTYPHSMNEQQTADAQDFLRQTIGKNAPPIYSDETITAYSVPPAGADQQVPAQFLDIGNGWFEAQSDATHTWRWAKSGGPSEIYIMNLTNAPVTVDLQFDAFGPKTSRLLQIALNTEPIATYNLAANGANQHFDMKPTLAPGNNVITFLSSEPLITTSNLDPKANDQRALTFAVSNVSLAKP